MRGIAILNRRIIVKENVACIRGIAILNTRIIVKENVACIRGIAILNTRIIVIRERMYVILNDYFSKHGIVKS
jgi:hypothetical protein